MPLELTNAVDALSRQKPEVRRNLQECARDDVKYSKNKSKVHSLKGGGGRQIHKAYHALPVPPPP